LKTVSLLRTAFALLLSLALVSLASAATLTYPSAKDAKFLIDIPDDWEGEPADEEGGFMNLTGPSGILVSLRTVKLSEYSMDDVVKEAADFIEENYTEVKWMDVTREANGTVGQAGVGMNQGDQVIFSNAWTPMETVIFELRLVASFGDDEGVKQGQAILSTIRGVK
jgi:hypothetical protein